MPNCGTVAGRRNRNEKKNEHRESSEEDNNENAINGSQIVQRKK